MCLPVMLSDVLGALPRLKELTLEYCTLDSALERRPSCSQRTSNITDLRIKRLQYDGPSTAQTSITVPCTGLFSLLPGLRTLHVEGCFLPIEVFTSGITSLTLVVPRLLHSLTRAHICDVLRAMPQLRRLTADDDGDWVHYPDGLSPFPHPEPKPLPMLRHLTQFSGSVDVGKMVLVGSPALELEEVMISETFGESAVEFIHLLQQHSAPIRRISVALCSPNFVGVVRAVFDYLPQCERLEITYPGESPIIPAPPSPSLTITQWSENGRSEAHSPLNFSRFGQP